MTDVAECPYVLARANARKRNHWCKLLGNEASRQRFIHGGWGGLISDCRSKFDGIWRWVGGGVVQMERG